MSTIQGFCWSMDGGILTIDTSGLGFTYQERAELEQRIKRTFELEIFEPTRIRGYKVAITNDFRCRLDDVTRRLVNEAQERITVQRRPQLEITIQRVPYANDFRHIAIRECFFENNAGDARGRLVNEAQERIADEERKLFTQRCSEKLEMSGTTVPARTFDGTCTACGYSECNCEARRTVADVLAPPPKPEHNLATCPVCKTVSRAAIDAGMPVLPKPVNADPPAMDGRPDFTSLRSRMLFRVSQYGPHLMLRP